MCAAHSGCVLITVGVCCSQWVYPTQNGVSYSRCVSSAVHSGQGLFSPSEDVFTFQCYIRFPSDHTRQLSQAAFLLTHNDSVVFTSGGYACQVCLKLNVCTLHMVVMSSRHSVDISWQKRYRLHSFRALIRQYLAPSRQRLVLWCTCVHPWCSQPPYLICLIARGFEKGLVCLVSFPVLLGGATIPSQSTEHHQAYVAVCYNIISNSVWEHL